MNPQRRELKYKINWQDARKSILNERFKGPRISFEPKIKEKSAADFSKRISEGDYEYGRKTTEIFSTFLKTDYNVLEIGPGPGTVTVPLSGIVNSVTSVDLSMRNISFLEKNLAEKGYTNVEVINKNWLRMDDSELEDNFDLVFCSHFLWMIPDLEEHLIKMENASRKCCAIVQPAGRGQIVKDVFTAITGQEYGGEFEPDADYFAYVIIREWGRLPEVRHFSYTNTMTIDEKVRSVASFIGRFVEVDREKSEKIRELVTPYAENGIFTETMNAVVMWWEI